MSHAKSNPPPSEANGPVSSALALEAGSALSLSQLREVLEPYGNGCEIRVKSYGLGMSDGQLWLGGELRVTWSSRLVQIPPIDGKTPRGPSEYYNLRFPPNNQLRNAQGEAASPKL